MWKVTKFLVVFGLAMAGTTVHANGDRSADSAGAPFEFRGEVAYLQIEGGFWGIVAVDGKRYDPGALPREFQQPGLRVRVVARLVQGRLSFRQWGQAIDIVALEREPTP